MRTSEHFVVKNKDFLKIKLCPNGQGEGGNFFVILCGRLLWTALNHYTICNNLHKLHTYST